MLKLPAKAVIFDLDGTLLNSMYAWRDAQIYSIEQALLQDKSLFERGILGGQSFNYQYDQEAAIESFHFSPEDAQSLWDETKELTLEQLSKFIFERYKVSVQSQQLLDWAYAYVEPFYENASFDFKPAADKLLSQLQESKIPHAIASATNAYYIRKYFKNISLGPKCIVCTDDVGKSKFCPDVYDYALQKLFELEDYRSLSQEALRALRSQVWVVEDTRHCAKTAFEAGYKVLAVHDEFSRDSWSQETHPPYHYFVNNFSELEFELI